VSVYLSVLSLPNRLSIQRDLTLHEGINAERSLSTTGNFLNVIYKVISNFFYNTLNAPSSECYCN